MSMANGPGALMAALTRRAAPRHPAVRVRPAGLRTTSSPPREQGWPDRRVTSKYFAAPAPANRRDARAGSFEVCVPSRGVVARVPADPASVAQTRLPGVPVALSCEQGICSCLMRVLGEPNTATSS